MKNMKIKKEYIKEFGYSNFNQFAESEYSKWLECELLKARCIVKSLDGNTVKRELLIDFIKYLDKFIKLTPEITIKGFIKDYLNQLND